MAEALKPRQAVLDMAPYSPPTSGRADKLRLDFNENTVGSSPKVVEFLTQHLSENGLAVYPEYDEVRPQLAAFFGVGESELLLTNGTDEAIQVLVNTYVDDGDDVLLLRPSYAMYRFYAEVAGASIREIDYRPDDLAFYPGTGFSDFFRDRFFLCDFRGVAAVSGVRSFRLKPKGAGFEIVDLDHGQHAGRSAG